MSTETNKQLIRDLIEHVYNQRNFDAIPDYFIAGSMLAGATANRLHYMSVSFPDFHYTIEDLLAEGEKVVSKASMSGTHLGDFFSHPPTGKPVMISGISIYTIRDGKILTMVTETNMLILYQQLGITPLIEAT